MNIFTKHNINRKLPEFFDALSNPTRYKVFVKILHEACECDLDEKGELWGNCVGEISKSLKLAQPTVSNHVKELVNAGLVQQARRGKKIYLFGTEKSVEQMKNFADFMGQEVYGLPHN